MLKDVQDSTNRPPLLAVATRKARSSELQGAAAIAAVTAALAIFFMGSTLLTPLYVLYERAFGFSRILLTLIFAVYVIGNLGALLFFGRLSDAIGRQRTTLFACAAAVFSTLLFLFAGSIAWLFMARMLSGFAVGLASGTTTAWLAELHGGENKPRATTVAAGANMVGLALGPLLAGSLAQYAPWPLHLSYVIYLAALIVIGLLVWKTRETVAHHRRFLGISLQPRIGVPRRIRAQFLAPAVTVFVVMALIGFYASLVPGILIENLHQTNRAVAGAVVFELFAVAATAVFFTQRAKSRTAMLSGLVLLLPSLALLVMAQAFASMPLLLISTTLGGISAALGYRGGLHVVNEIAPDDQRAEVVSSYLVVGFTGNSLPVVGMGVIASVSSPMMASLIFAGTIAVFALVALVAGVKYIPKT